MSRDIKVYTVSELKEKFPDGFDRAFEEYKKDVSNDPYLPWQEVIMDSLKATIKSAGFTLKDWEIGAYCYSRVKIEFPETWQYIVDADGNETDEEEHVDIGEFTKEAALQYLFNEFDIKEVKKVFYKYDGKKHHRWDAIKKNGEDWSCEFTGVCFDHEFLHSILDDIESGDTIHDAFNNLADVARKLFEDEYEAQLEEDYFIQEAEANYYEYTEDGDRI